MLIVQDVACLRKKKKTNAQKKTKWHLTCSCGGKHANGIRVFDQCNNWKNSLAAASFDVVVISVRAHEIDESDSEPNSGWN